MNWLRQPTTIHGIAAIVASAVAAGLIYLGHVAPAAAGFAASAIFGAICMAMNDNSADAKPVEQFVEDAANAIVAHRLGDAVPALVADLQRVIFQAPAAPPAAAPPIVVPPVVVPVATPVPTPEAPTA